MKTEIRLYRGYAYVTIWNDNIVTYFLNKKPYKTIKGLFNAIDKQIKKNSIENFMKKRFGIN